MNPDDAAAYNNRGAAYGKLKQYERAVEDYGKAIALNPDFAAAYRNRGIVHAHTGRYEESAQDLKKAGILFSYSARNDDSVKAFSYCFDLREELENVDVIYCGLAQFLITLDPDVIIELKKMRVQDERVKKIFDLAVRKLYKEDIVDEITTLEKEEKREEMKLLFDLIKRE